MSTQTFTCFPHLAQELQIQIWGHAINDSVDAGSPHLLKAVMSDGVSTKGVIGPTSGRRLHGLDNYWDIMRSCALARKLCLHHYRSSLVDLMEGYRTTWCLPTKAARDAAMKGCADRIGDVDELLRRLESRSKVDA